MKATRSNKQIHQSCRIKDQHTGTLLVVQRLRLHAPNAGGLGSILGQGTRSRMPQ